MVKHVKLNQPGKPSGIIWVEFDDQDVGRKARQENKTPLYSSRNPTDMDTNQTSKYTVRCGQNKSAQVVRKQFPLHPAAAKTVHRSQGDTRPQIVVNLNTRRAIPHIHYVALSRVTTMEGLYITDLC